MNLTEQFLQLALLGANWVLWLLMFLSIASLAVIFERWIFYRSLEGIDAKLLAPVNDALSGNDHQRAKELAKSKKSTGARILVKMLDAAPRGHKSVQAILVGSQTGEKLRLERNLNFLGTVGANAPFIGLFGTVLEILRVFRLLGEGGVGSGQEAQQIMTGISEALVATAVGLLVAIPAVVAYNSASRKVKRLLAYSESLTYMALAQLSDNGDN